MHDKHTTTSDPAVGSTRLVSPSDEFETRMRRLSNGVDSNGVCAARWEADQKNIHEENIRFRRFRDRLAIREYYPKGSHQHREGQG